MIQCINGVFLKKFHNEAMTELSNEYGVEILKLVNLRMGMVAVIEEHLVLGEIHKSSSKSELFNFFLSNF